MNTKAGHSETPIIEMNDVSISSLLEPERVVVTGINWSVAQGEYWVIAGMHGSGKTDFITTTAGLMSPKDGTYRLFGREMPLFSEELLAQRLRLGVVFESGHLLRHLSIAENVALPLRYHGKLHGPEIERRVNEVLELTELTPWAKSMGGSLSHSWQKRAVLARALMLQPEVLLADGPLGGLDPRHAHWWIQFLNQLSAGHPILNGRPVTLVVTTEDLRPWQNPACQFALLAKEHFTVLGRQPDLATHSEPLVHELLAETIANA